jgi:hypothetical protein
MSELITVAKVIHSAEAESIRLLLASHEIPVVLQGEHTGAMLSHLGTAVGARVCVPQAFAERAMEIIASHDRRRTRGAEQGAWYCGPCREEVDAGFETCWSCGQPREEVERPFPQDRQTSAAEATTADSSRRKASADDTVRRAWRTSVLGMFYVPFVSHLYSASKLLEASAHWDSLSQESKKLFRRTMILDLLMLGGFVALVSMILGRF